MIINISWIYSKSVKYSKKGVLYLKSIIQTIYNAVVNYSVGEVIMLHRVDYRCKNMLPCMAELTISPTTLENFIKDNLATRNFISVSELVACINREKCRTDKKFLCFTMDDGYKDIYIYAYPIFKKYNVPFCIFITTDFINNDRAFNWPYIIEQIVLQHDRIELSDGRIFNSITLAEKEQTFRTLKSILQNISYQTFRNDVEQLFEKYLPFEDDENLHLSWDEIREMVASGLCTIGGHTINHSSLAHILKEEMKEEIKGCKDVLESSLNQEINCFAYPFGSVSDVNSLVMDVTKECGYQISFISHGGSIRRNDKNLFSVKRIMLQEDGIA